MMKNGSFLMRPGEVSEFTGFSKCLYSYDNISIFLSHMKTTKGWMKGRI